jgi:hypothetical protein
MPVIRLILQFRTVVAYSLRSASKRPPQMLAYGLEHVAPTYTIQTPVRAGLGGLAAAADVEGVDDVGEAEPDRGLGELRGLQVTAVAGPAGIQEPALGRRALPVLDLQVLAEAGRVRNR